MPTFRSHFRVRSYELDGLGHLNHAVYLNYFEQARFEALESGGFPLDLLEARGWGVHVVRIEVDYRRECRMGHRLAVVTRAEEFRKSSMTLVQELVLDPAPNDGGPDEDEALAARARVVLVWVGSDRRPMRIPDEVRAALG